MSSIGTAELETLVRDLRKFDGKREVVKELRTEIRKPIPEVRKAIKRRALETLPKSGGLNRWVARVRVSAVIKTAGRAAGVTLKGSKKSAKGKSDLRRLDLDGRIRHPSWKRRGKGDWHTQTVNDGFFSKPSTETTMWQIAVERAVSRAVRTIAGG